MTGGPIINEPAPYALLYVHGAPVALTRAQFEQAARDGALCRCNACVACTARAYSIEHLNKAHAASHQTGRMKP